MQTITTSADRNFEREIQVITTTSNSIGQVVFTMSGASNSVTVPDIAAVSDADMKGFVESLSNVNEVAVQIAAAVEGVIEPFVIQARDVFMNTLEGPLRSFERFAVTLEHSNGNFMEASLVSKSNPNTDGLYDVDYFPKLTGTYTMSLKHRQQGGLLATFYRNADLSSPVLGHGEHCLNGQQTQDPVHGTWECDSTMLSKTISSDWGVDSALPSFPADEFSVRWNGLLEAPVSETFTFFVEADDGVRLYLNGVLVIDEWYSPTSEVSGDIDLEFGLLYSIILEYRDINGPANIKLSWSSPSVPKSIIPSSNFYYERHLDGSPMTVEVTPGEVDSNTSYIEGPGLINALDIFTFNIFAQDSHGNSQYNNGSDDWIVSVEGSGGWAEVGRINSVVIDTPTYYYPSEICSDCVTDLNGDIITLNLGTICTGEASTFELKEICDHETQGQLIEDVHFNVDTGAESCNFVLSSINFTTSNELVVESGHSCSDFSGSSYPLKLIVKRDWEYLGIGSVSHGSPEVVANSGSLHNVRSGLLRGHEIILGEEVFTVNVDETTTFDSTHIPLSSPFLGSTADVYLYKGGVDTGIHQVSFVPRVKGTYKVTVKRPARQEVQSIVTTVSPTSALDGSSSLTFIHSNAEGEEISETTDPIAYDAPADGDVTSIATKLEQML